MGPTGLCRHHLKLVSVFQELLRRAVAKTDGAEVEPLEKLYARLAQCIYRHRDNCNKAELLQVRRPQRPRGRSCDLSINN